MDNDAFGGSGDLAGELGGGSFSDAGGSYQGNVVGSENQPGGWMTGSGTGLVSQGMNISLGLDPNHGPIGAFAGANPNAPNQTAIDVAATLLNMTPEDLLDASGRDEFGAKDSSQLSTSGLDRGTLEAMSAAGYGGLNITGNQTVDQALAAFNTSDVMDKAFPGLANALVPGFGTLSSVSKALVGLHQGYLTPAQALAQIGLGVSGIPTGLFDKSIVGPSLDSVGMTTPSTEPSGTAGGGASTSDAVMPPVSSVSSASPQGLVALLGGASSDDEEKEQANMADIRRGIAMTPYGMPYGG